TRGRTQGDRSARGDAARDGEAGRGRAREALQADPRRGRVPGRPAPARRLGDPGRGAGRAPAALPPDAHRDRQRAELDDPVPAAHGPAPPALSRQRDGGAAHGTGPLMAKEPRNAPSEERVRRAVGRTVANTVAVLLSLAVLAAWASFGFYTLAPGQAAVILQLGRYVRKIGRASCRERV